MYVQERMKADPALLRAFINGSYSDIYTANAFGSYLTLSLDPDSYREKIRRAYEGDGSAYLSLEKAESKKEESVADAKIRAFASGKVGEYTEDSTSLARLQAEKEAFARYLMDFYASRWPSFSADALLFIGNIALEEKNYPLALDCLAVADANSPKYGLSPAALDALKTKGAVAVLEAASFIRDNAKKMGVELLSQHLKSLEKACAATGRPFPDDLWKLRAGTYPKAMAYYAKKYSAEKDPSKKDYYRENLDYFSAAAAPAVSDK
jgi:hypothetical protein